MLPQCIISNSGPHARVKEQDTNREKTAYEQTLGVTFYDVMMAG